VRATCNGSCVPSHLSGVGEPPAPAPLAADPSSVDGGGAEQIDLAGVGARLLRFAYLLVGDRGEAEDLVQATLETSISKREQVATSRSPEQYLRAVLLNELRARRRRRAGSEPPVAPGAATDRSDGSDVADSVIGRLVLGRALLTLPDSQRAALVLRYYADASDEQIAEVLGCRRATVRSHVRRGLAAIRLALAHAGDPFGTGGVDDG
jgi:RNA polymerase sigma factor (sigma-70 family)